MNAGIVKNPKKTIPISTILGVLLVSLLYLGSCTVFFGLFSAPTIAQTSAPFSLSANLILGSWAGPIVSLFTAVSELAAMGGWMLLVSQAAIRASDDGALPSFFAKTNRSGIPALGLVITSLQMTLLMLAIMLFSAHYKAQSFFAITISIAANLTIFPYFYSALYLLKKQGIDRENPTKSLPCFIVFLVCFVLIFTEKKLILSISLIITLGSFIFFALKQFKKGDSHKKQNYNDER